MLSEDRKNRFPNVVFSTLSNVAINMCLYSMSQRFIWSGLQTYCDVIDFVNSCIQGRHPFIVKKFSIIREKKA